MRVGTLIFALPLCILTACASVDQHCFRDHLKEAISLNENRRSDYASLAADVRPEHDLSEQSQSVSDLLINGEQKAVLASYLPTGFWKGINFDSAAKKYQQAGIPIVCEDFVPMEEVPGIQLTNRPFPDPEDRYPGRTEYDFDDESLADFGSVANVLEQEIERLSIEPRFNCLSRHVLESALRISNHAPIYIDMARMKGLPSPEKLLWTMTRSHFWLMDEVMEIDHLAAPLQARGIPIVCNDLPSIPPYSEKLMQLYEDIGRLDPRSGLEPRFREPSDSAGGIGQHIYITQKPDSDEVPD